MIFREDNKTIIFKYRDIQNIIIRHIIIFIFSTKEFKIK